MSGRPWTARQTGLVRLHDFQGVATEACFLAGPEVGYITGGALDVSGGYQV